MDELSKAQALKWLQLPPELARVEGERFIVEDQNLIARLGKEGVISLRAALATTGASRRTKAGGDIDAVVSASFDLEKLENIAGMTRSEAQQAKDRAQPLAVGV